MFQYLGIAVVGTEMAEDDGVESWSSERDLARALAEGEPKAQAYFYKQILVPLLGPYVRRRVRQGDLRNDHEDILHEFFVQKVAERETAGTIFGPVASGEKPLLPVVWTCFINHLCSRFRARRVESRLGHVVEPGFWRKAEDKTGEDESEEQREQFEKVALHIKARIDLLAGCRDLYAGHRAPHYQALLLSERVAMFNRIVAGVRRGDYGDAAHLLFDPVQQVEMRMAWPTDVGSHRLSSGKTFDEAWTCLREAAVRSEQISGDRVAEVLGVSRDCWDQWVSRARQAIVEAVGEAEARKLFPYWPHRKGGTK